MGETDSGPTDRTRAVSETALNSLENGDHDDEDDRVHPRRYMLLAVLC